VRPDTPSFSEHRLRFVLTVSRLMHIRAPISWSGGEGAAGAALQQRSHDRRLAVRGAHEHACRQLEAHDLGKDGPAAEQRHADVQQRDVRPVLDGCHRVGARACCHLCLAPG